MSESAIAKASRGVFSRSDEELEYLSDADVRALFDSSGDVLKIKPFLSGELEWLVADALDSGISRILEPQDFVLANNFLGALWDAEAERCLSNIAPLVKPGGYLVLFGVDLDLRTRWVKRQGYTPITDRIEEVYTGDRTMLYWPWERFGLEPLDKRRADWRTRYAAVFQVPDLQGADPQPPSGGPPFASS